MTPMSDDQYGKARLKVRDTMMRLTLRKVRDMRNKYGRRPRTYRLTKEFRVLRSLLRDEARGRPHARKRRQVQGECRRRAK